MNDLFENPYFYGPLILGIAALALIIIRPQGDKNKDKEVYDKIGDNGDGHREIIQTYEDMK